MWASAVPGAHDGGPDARRMMTYGMGRVKNAAAGSAFPLQGYLMTLRSLSNVGWSNSPTRSGVTAT
jgi:hypothetical protein